LANLALSSFQKRIGQDLATKPGAEMLAAVKQCDELNIPYCLIDREVQVTLRRAWKKSSFWGKNKLLGILMGSMFGGEEKFEAQKIEDLKKKSELEGMMEELARELPTIKQVLIDERDQYLATSLYLADGNTKVAVVGAGHVPGMVSWLTQLHEGQKTPDLAEISVVPPPSPWSRIWPWVIPGVIVALFVVGFFLKGSDALWSMLGTWALATGGASAIGAALALAHPVTIAVAFLLAPITTLHPLLGIGMLTGLSEAYFRKPRVADLQNLSTDAAGLRGFYRNRITRILLVFLLSSVGASIAVYMNLPMLTQTLLG
jgi:pheromone shutdown-related protein TraB